MKRYLSKIFDKLEDTKIPFYNYLLLILAATTLRNFLEIFSDKAKVPFVLFGCNQSLYYGQWVSLFFSFLHYYTVWAAIALGVVIILQIALKQPLVKAARVVFALFFLINITPIFDLLISGGFGKNLTYLRPRSLADIFPWPKGMTIGMALTALTGMAAVYSYAIIKGVRRLAAFGAVVLVYLLLVIFAILPFALHLTHPLAIIRVVWLIILAQAALVFFIDNPKLFLGLLTDIRFKRLVYFLMLFLLGISLIKVSPFELIGLRLDAFFLTLIVVGGCWYTSVIFNNIEDRDIDSVSNVARPLIQGSITLAGYEMFGFCVMAATIWSGLLVNLQTAIFALLLMGNTFFYSLSPLRAKRIPVFSKLLASFNCLLIVMLGFIFAGGNLRSFPPPVTWYFLVFITFAYNFIDLKDYDGDKQAGIKTLPVILGKRPASLVIGCVCIITYAVSGLVFVNLWLLLFGLVIGAIQFYLINRTPYRENPVMLLHLVIVVAMLVTLVVFGSSIQQEPSILITR